MLKLQKNIRSMRLAVLIGAVMAFSCAHGMWDYVKSLTLLCRIQKHHIIDAAKNGDLKGVIAALEQDENVDAKDNKGYTALMWASYHGHTEIVTILLAHGANVNEKDNEGFTALKWAAYKDQREVCVMLLGRGAMVTSIDVLENALTQNGWLDLLQPILYASTKDVLIAHQSGFGGIKYYPHHAFDEFFQWYIQGIDCHQFSHKQIYEYAPLALKMRGIDIDAFECLLKHIELRDLDAVFTQEALTWSVCYGDAEKVCRFINYLHEHSTSMAAQNVLQRIETLTKKSKIPAIKEYVASQRLLRSHKLLDVSNKKAYFHFV